jgi:hypothetical protein
MASDRSSRRRGSESARREREDVFVDRNAEEALRRLARILARESARELFEKLSVTVESDDSPKA